MNNPTHGAEVLKPEGYVPDPLRYEKIEAANGESFLFNEPEAFTVITSIGGQETRLHPHLKARDGSSIVFAGNMSEMWGQKSLPDDERIADARLNVDTFLRSPGIEVDPANVHILLPQRGYDIPLKLIDIDELPVNPDKVTAEAIEERGDMLVTKNPNIVLGVRPADCPVLLGYGINAEGERENFLAHIASGGAAAGFVAQFADRLKERNIDPESVRISITPGAHAENYPFKSLNNPLEGKEGLEKLFVNIHEIVEDGEKKLEYGIDTPFFVYDELIRLGFDPYQLMLDTSDTGSFDTEYSSNGRSERSRRAWVAKGSPEDEDHEVGKRDLIIMVPRARL